MKKSHPRLFPIFLEVIPELPWLGKSSRSGEDKKKKKKNLSLSVRGRKKDEGGITRVKLALCQKPVRSPPWISEYDRERKTQHIKSSHA